MDEAEYRGLIQFLNIQMKKSAEKKEFEQAILWRDGIDHLENKLDIYDAMHVINLLRARIPHHEIEEFLGNFRAQYARMQSGQPERRD